MLGGPRPVLLHGRPYALVIPLLDGRTPDSGLVAALAGRLPAAVVHTVLLRLAARGLLVHVVGTEAPPAPFDPPAVPADLVDAFVPPGPDDVRWVAAGVDDALVARLVAAVGSAPAAGACGLTVLVADDLLRDEVPALLARCAALDVPVLPIRAAGAEWSFGPLVRGVADASVGPLLRARLRVNRADDVDALRRGATFPLRGAPPVSEAVVEAGIAFAATVIDGVRAGDPPAPVVDRLLVLDARDGTTEAHPLVAMTPEQGGATLEDTWARMAPLVDPVTGIVGGVEPVPALPGTFVCASAGTLDWPAGDGPPVFRGGTLGKGLSDLQARVSCVGEAIELVSVRWTGTEERRRARWSEVRDVAVHPRELLLFSDAQYAEAARRPEAAPWDGVPAPFDERHAIEWVPAVSLVDGATRWLPAACCYVDYLDPEYPAAPFAVANANGCAAANTRERAILQGLLELLERDATALWWYTRARRPGVALESVDDARIAAVRDAHAAQGRELALLDLRTDTGVPVVAAVTWDPVTGVALPTGHGCHPDPARAIARAVAELSQVIAIASPVDTVPAAPPTVGDRPHLLPDDAPLRRAEDLAPAGIGTDVDARLAWCVERLAGLGHDVLVLDVTREEIGQPAVRVVVPGLRPLLRRLAPGRLYDVPAALGWVPRAPREDEVNPDAFGT